ncbi:hypothetical protein [Nocardioides zeae]
MGPRRWIVAAVIVLVVVVGGALLIIGLTTADEAEGSAPATPTETFGTAGTSAAHASAAA